MDVKQHFVKIIPPSPDQYSPKKSEETTQNASLKMQSSSNLVEIRLGNYIVKAERISNNQTIDGYAALYDQKRNILFEGEFLRSKRNGFGL